MLLIVDSDDRMVGLILFFRRVTVPPLGRIPDRLPRCSAPTYHGKGYTTEALGTADTTTCSPVNASTGWSWSP